MGGEEFVVIGQITRPHGLNGEMKVMPITDFPERFETQNRFFVRTQGKHSEWKALSQLRWQKPFVLIKFEGIESREAADALRGATIEMPREFCHALPEGEFYISDLIGLSVKTNSGQKLGILADILQQTAQDIFVIQQAGKELLIPAVDEFIEKIDIEKGEIIINPIEGLLD